MASQDTKKELTVRLVNDGGETYKELKLEFKTVRLRRSVTKELKKKVEVTNFAEFDSENLDPENIKFKSLDFKAMLEAQDAVEEQLVYLLWGFPSEQKRDDIASEDYDLMLKAVKEYDPLGLEKQREDAKKKMEEKDLKSNG